MSSAFVPLAEFLRPPQREPELEPIASQSAEPADGSGSNDSDEALRAIRRFRAALEDALEARVEELLRRIACDVLARELQLAPAQTGEIVAAARAALQPEHVIAVHVHPDELGALEMLDLEVVADRAVQRGDVRIALRSGTIELTLAARLEAALAALA